VEVELMIKVRLHGVKEEIQAYIEKMQNDKSIKILSESGIYKDKGKSSYVRCYLDVEDGENNARKYRKK
jgi:hypothetical protein